ncbi:unnamed protein product [Blepharisma stoltei]|uniref:Uncharacterized protein n=1 Tax=Blepharisma stoltei TaxID=1481888 RepID=A0AAU9IUY4_9CILI|nr:unnamed protein product [Blepharisma stoltei]
MEESFRPSQYEQPADGVEYAPSEENDMLNQLRDKVRSQAQRLRGLEQYRALCEERIQQLSPGHPIPLKPEHLGTNLNSQNSQELHLAKQKIAKLEQQLAQQQIKVPLAENYTFPPPSTQLTLNQLQELYSAIYYQHHDTIKEKNALEESLRAEMLTSEEQRTYIEVLKQALETRMEDLGYVGTTDDFAEFAQSKTKNDKNRRENSKLAATIENQEEKLKQILDQLREKSKQCEAYENERQISDKHLQEAADALQFAEEEVEKLEEEKAALLEYADQLTSKEKEYLEEIENSHREIAGIKENLGKIGNELKIEIEKRNSYENELEKVKHDKEKLENAWKLSKEEFKEVADLKDQYENELSAVKEQLKAISKINEALQANNATLNNTLKETQAEMDALQVEHDEAKSEAKKLRKNLENIENKLKDIKKSRDEKIQELEETLIFKEKEQKQLKETLSSQKDAEVRQSIKQLENVQQELQKSWTEYQSVLKRELALSKETNELKKQTLTMQEEIEKLSSENLQLTSGISELKNTFNQTNSHLFEVSQEKSEMEGEINRLTAELKKEIESSELLKAENESIKNMAGNLNSSLQQTNELYRDRDMRLQNSLYEIDSLKSQLKSTRDEIEREIFTKKQYYEELCRYKSEISLIDSHNKENEKIKESIRNCCKIISIFTSNFGAISAATSAYGTVVSSQFKDLIVKWNANSLEDVQFIGEWLHLSCEELEALIRRLSDAKQDYNYTTQKLGSTQQKYDALSVDEMALRNREQNLREQVAALNNEKSKFLYENETSINKIRSLQVELNSLKKDYQALYEENIRMKDQLKLSTSEISQFRNTAGSDSFSIRASEEKTNLLLKEKKELESLLSRLQRAVPSQDIQRIFLDIMKSHSEIEILNREKLRIENQLLRSESEMRSLARSSQQEKAIQVRKEVESLRTQLNNCDSQIQSHKRRMFNMEEELKEIETIERRRHAISLETERAYVDVESRKDIHSSHDKTETKDQYLSRTFDPEMSFSHYETRFTDYDPENKPSLPHFDKLRRSNIDF